ncbi:MAG: hypothetical protein QOH47_2361 [Sphingomonadales bacterium]|jgi:integrase|nr:hypothetical protein [Sphingomonadales bacterium]
MPDRPGSSTATGRRAAKPISSATTPAQAGQRFELGRFWLWYRPDRDDWNICWLDSRVVRRKATGVGGGGDYPPEGAREALADHWAADRAEALKVAPAVALPPGEVLVPDLVALWLEQHVAGLDAPERYLDSVAVWERFWSMLAADGLLPDPLTVSAITGPLVDRFIAFRGAEGAAPPTISRDIAALRGPIRWGLDNNRLAAAPKIKDVKGRKRIKALEWSPEQVAALLEAAAATPDRAHVHLYAMIMLSTHARSEAVLELNAETQIGRGQIDFLRPGEEQTRKRRAIVPICPTLAPWLAGVRGKVIRYRVPTSARTRADGGEEWFERPTSDIGNAFAGVLLAAHELRPDLGFARQMSDESGQLEWLPPRPKLGETTRRAKLRPIGTPNTLRHTIHTWHKRQGVPDAQIDAAAGHSEEGTGASYTHLRPEYLREFIASTEAFWEAVGEFTDAHLRYPRDTKVVAIGAGRSRGNGE